ncbi:hypothetical protein CL614_02820 [archaeon]|nr:hypothetical protein [archaeon]
MEKFEKTHIIIDGLNVFTRHYIANPSTTENGEQIGGVIGTINSLMNLCEKFSPDSIWVIWEGGGSKRKRDIYPDYKSGRKPQKLNRYYDTDLPDTVQNRNYQIRTIIEILNNVSIRQMYVPDCEADDVIGYICKYNLRNERKVIVSSDKDFYQLLDNKTLIYSPTWKKFVSFKEVRDKFEISAENFCLAKAVCGDKSDSIPGVKGAGFKTLSKRFKMLKLKKSLSVDDLLVAANDQIELGSNIKIFSSILKSEEVIRRNWRLIILDTNNLSSFQIQKLNQDIDTFEPVRNKMNAMKIIKKELIQNLNIDRLFLVTKNLI